MAANGISTLSTKLARQTAKLNIAQLKRKGYTLYADGTTNFGSAQFSGSNEITLSTKTAFGFGTGDFTVEGWFNPTNLTGTALFDFRTAASELAIYLNLNTGGNARLYVNGAYVITTTSTVSAATWSHIAVTRFNGSTKVFINGTQSGVTYADANDYGTTKPLSIGSSYTSASHLTGYVSNVRIVKGTAVYTQNFTASSSPFTAIAGTQLLLNTDNGANFLKDSSANNFTVTNTGTVVTSNTGPGPDTNAAFYRTRNNYDITQLPDTYATTADDNPNVGGLVVGRPWTSTPPGNVDLYGFFENQLDAGTWMTFDETIAGVRVQTITTNFNGTWTHGSYIKVNGTVIASDHTLSPDGTDNRYDALGRGVTTTSPTDPSANDYGVGFRMLRGHTIIILNPATATSRPGFPKCYDTYGYVGTGASPAAGIANDIKNAAANDIILMGTFDATSCTQEMRDAMTTYTGANSYTNTWGNTRISHMFLAKRNTTP